MKGKLTFVAKTAGIKINDSDEWINPTPEAKLDIINNIDKIKEWVGCQVELIINDKGNYIGIKKITDKPKNN